jgi:hypothetical protein
MFVEAGERCSPLLSFQCQLIVLQESFKVLSLDIIEDELSFGVDSVVGISKDEDMVELLGDAVLIFCRNRCRGCRGRYRRRG